MRLIRENVEIIVDDNKDISELQKQGYKVVEEGQQQSTNEEDPKDLNTLTVEQLKALATEKGIEFPSGIKKDDLINLIDGVE